VGDDHGIGLSLRLAYNSLLATFRRYLIKAEIDCRQVDLHSLRVTFIVHAIDGGVAAKTVQAIVGHKTFAMATDTYYRMRPEKLLEADLSCLPCQ